MKLFLVYLRQKRRALLFFFGCGALLLLSFLLYGLPLAAVLYPLCLCLLLGSGLLLTEYVRVKRTHRKMEELLNTTYELLPNLPDSRSIAETDYQQLIFRLCRELETMAREDSNRYLEALDYYTVWAHQIKTPIAAMKLRLSREDSPLSRELQGELFRVEQYADMVMAYLRLEESEGDYVFRPVELDGLLRACIRRFSGEFIARHLSLSYEPTDLSLVTDEKWLSFVVEQLLSNAVKYTTEGGVTIRVSDNALRIEDTGMGIAPEDLPRVFEKGYTGYNGRKDKRASGIGLYLCKRVCDRLGLTLRCESVLNEGTNMIIEIVTKT